MMALLHSLFAVLVLFVSSASAVFFLSRANSGSDVKFGLFESSKPSSFIPERNTENVHTSYAENISNGHGNAVGNTEDNIENTQENYAPNKRCEQRSERDFRPHPSDCTKFIMCSRGSLITFDCPYGSVFHKASSTCVPHGSYFDTCSRAQVSNQICPPGATYKKAHPHKCALYYHCGQPAQNRLWENHLKECEYPMLYNEVTHRCEHHTMVACGARIEPYDPCEYRANLCEGHVQCVPCKVRHPSCRSKPNGMNAWKGREGSPYYVVCANQRVVYSGMCSQRNGIQVFDQVAGICRYRNGLPW